MTFYLEMPVDELKQVIRDNPSEVDLRMILIRRLAAGGEIGDALSVTEKALLEFPDHAELLATKSICLMSMGELEQGYELLQVVARRSPGDELLDRIIEETLPCFGEVTQEHLFDPRAVIDRISELNTDGQLNKRFVAKLESSVSLVTLFVEQMEDTALIEETLLEHLERFPEDLNMKLELARLYCLIGNVPEEERCYREVIAADPLCATAYFELATTVVDVDEALEFSRKGLELCPGFECGRLNYGAYLSNRGNYTQALRELSRIPADSPLYAISLSNIGVVYLQQDRLSEAIDVQSKIVALNPGDGAAWYQYGHLCVLIEDYEAALTHFDQSLKIDCEDLDALNGRAVTLGRLGRHAEAIEVLRYALQISPNEETLLATLAIQQADLGSRKDAIETLARALELYPDNAHMWLTLGRYYCGEERLDESLKCSRKALELDPTRGLALWNIACVHAKRNQKEECFSNLKRSVELVPEMALRILEDDDLQPFLNDPRFTELARPSGWPFNR